MEDFFYICLKNSDVVRIYHDHKNKILILIFFNKMFANSFDIVYWFSVVINPQCFNPLSPLHA